MVNLNNCLELKISKEEAKYILAIMDALQHSLTFLTLEQVRELTHNQRKIDALDIYRLRKTLEEYIGEEK